MQFIPNAYGSYDSSTHAFQFRRFSGAFPYCGVGIGNRLCLTCILKVSKNQGGFDLLSPLDSSRMLGTWEIVS